MTRRSRHVLLAGPILGCLLAGAAVPAAEGHPTQSTEDAADAYERGLRLREAGNWDGALDVWEAAWDSMAFSGGYDPRIGIAYIETATAEKAEARYERANEMYLWGLSTHETGRFEDALADEVARIEPLVPFERQGRLTDLLEAGDPRFVWELKRFWIEADPTPTTRYNERLIEHWERIAYARDRYVNGTYTVYDTDDRGEIYVRYGPPGKRRAGTLGTRENELQFWVSDLDSRNALRRYDKHPTYEVWAYDDLNADEFVYFLFGQEDGAGRFKLVDGPADLIAPEAYSASTRRYTPGGIRAGFFIELFYYSELSIIGGPYGRRFDELDRAWQWSERDAMRQGAAISPPSESELESYRYEYIQEDRYSKTWVPEIASLSEHDLPPRYLNMRAFAFRSLSPSNEPRVTVVALSAPRLDVERRRLEGDLRDPDYTLGHTLIVRDERLDEVGRMDAFQTSARGDISIFPLNHVDRQLHFTVVTETRSGGPGLSTSGRPPGRAHIAASQPLDPDPSSLEVSDLIIGVVPWSEGAAQALPFPVLPSRSVWEDESLRVFLEVYHLRPNEEGVHGYGADFVVRPLDDEGAVEEDPEPVTLSVDLESARSMAQGSFDLDVRDLPTGRYRLDVTVRDRVTGEETTRTTEFEIVGR